MKVIVGGHYLYESCPWKMYGVGVTTSKGLRLGPAAGLVRRTADPHAGLPGR
ncbi:MAG: hypothetical protein Ct9H300mP1_22070 [Planctomycetaceae bacterium]|nr:MAG: hypothetical protein Ct9H300mP1_22070 [Planctomycetaceae bacterium]